MIMQYLNIRRGFNTLFLLTVLSNAYAADVMVLGTTELAPFTYLEGSEFKGEAIEPIHRILTRSKIPYRLVYLKNYSVLLKALRKQTIDGFFVATQNAERDKYAELSKPLIIDHYSWFILRKAPYDLDTNDFKLHAKVGAVSGTNSFRLATRRGYQVYGQPMTLLAQQFINQTLDAVFATQRSFEHQLTQANFPKDKYRIVFESERPFGLYISKHYLERHPNAMILINQQIELFK